MKKIMKNQGAAESPRFVVGALAAAGASAASGATVQITFANNVVSSVTGVSNFTADLTGDEVDDFIRGSFGNNGAALTYRGGTFAQALNVDRYGNRGRYAWVGASRRFASGSVSAAVVRNFVSYRFKDMRINGNSFTWSYLDVEAVAGPGGYFVRIHRLIFDDASTIAPTGVSMSTTYSTYGVSAVPEPGSNLALLALGAGGLTLRRRLKRAA